MIIGSNLIYIKSLPSTNTSAAVMLKERVLTEGTIIHTNFQSAGKGYSSNKWESEDGKNLLISIILYPTFIEPVEQFFISMTISLGICDFLVRYIPGCSIKWPNDIYVNNDKIAGLLIESSIRGDHIESTIAGIGLNINQKKFLSDAPNPVSLSLLSFSNHDLDVCLYELTTDLDKRYKQLIAGDFIEIKNEYVSKLYRLNEWHEFRDSLGTHTGRILTIGDSGKLKIEYKTGKIMEYSFKEVEFIL